ncbi:MAG: hypothetical protein LBI69_03715 [Puniceicoccales bacterium]|jgi:HD superfamily phosphohydrolase YqeK|nr:hypothetical protein [Puniceicoccales bacterium]
MNTNLEKFLNDIVSVANEPITEAANQSQLVKGIIALGEDENLYISTVKCSPMDQQFQDDCMRAAGRLQLLIGISRSSANVQFTEIQINCLGDVIVKSTMGDSLLFIGHIESPAVAAATYAIEKFYSKAYPSAIGDLMVIPHEHGERVHWVNLSPDEQWKLFQKGSVGIGGKKAVEGIQYLLNQGYTLQSEEIQRRMSERIEVNLGAMPHIHGPLHSLRTAVHVETVGVMYKFFFKEFTKLSDGDIELAKIAAIFHDSGRQSDGSDIYDEISAQNAEDYMRLSKFPEELCIRVGNAIRNKDSKERDKDLIAILLHEADCLEYKRIKQAEFNLKFMDYHQFKFKINDIEICNGNEKACFENNISKIVLATEKFILGSANSDIRNYHTMREIAMNYYKLFPIESPRYCKLCAAEVTDEELLLINTEFNKISDLQTQLISENYEFANVVQGILNNWGNDALHALLNTKTRPYFLNAISLMRPLLNCINEYANIEKNQCITQIGRSVEAIIINAMSIAFGNANNVIFVGFSKGKFSKVLYYRENDGPCVFKSLISDANPSDTDMEVRWGIPRNTTIGRNLAPQVVNAYLSEIGGAPRVVVEAKLKVANGVPGISMEQAPGREVMQSATWDIANDPEYRRQETWLQLIDCITGELDRHGNNVFYDPKTQKLTAIDFDGSFPIQQLRNAVILIDSNGKFRVDNEMRKAIKDKNLANSIPDCLYIVRKDIEIACGIDELGVQNYCMPPVIDETMKEAILKIDINELQSRLEKTGLSDEQIKAAMVRVQCMKNIIGNKKIHTINLLDWNVSANFAICECDNCYFLHHLPENLGMCAKINYSVNYSAVSCIVHAAQFGNCDSVTDTIKLMPALNAIMYLEHPQTGVYIGGGMISEINTIETCYSNEELINTGIKLSGILIDNIPIAKKLLVCIIITHSLNDLLNDGSFVLFMLKTLNLTEQEIIIAKAIIDNNDRLIEFCLKQNATVDDILVYFETFGIPCGEFFAMQKASFFARAMHNSQISENQNLFCQWKMNEIADTLPIKREARIKLEGCTLNQQAFITKCVNQRIQDGEKQKWAWGIAKDMATLYQANMEDLFVHGVTSSTQFIDVQAWINWRMDLETLLDKVMRQEGGSLKLIHDWQSQQLSSSWTPFSCAIKSILLENRNDGFNQNGRYFLKNHTVQTLLMERQNVSAFYKQFYSIEFDQMLSRSLSLYLAFTSIGINAIGHPLIVNVNGNAMCIVRRGVYAAHMPQVYQTARAGDTISNQPNGIAESTSLHTDPPMYFREGEYGIMVLEYLVPITKVMTAFFLSTVFSDRSRYRHQYEFIVDISRSSEKIISTSYPQGFIRLPSTPFGHEDPVGYVAGTQNRLSIPNELASY